MNDFILLLSHPMILNSYHFCSFRTSIHNKAKLESWKNEKNTSKYKCIYHWQQGNALIFISFSLNFYMYMCVSIIHVCADRSQTWVSVPIEMDLPVFVFHCIWILALTLVPLEE